MHHVLTANRLIDGAVVYWTADGGWSDHLDAAKPLQTPTDLASAESAGQQAQSERKVVGAYAMDVALEGGNIRPLRMREIIRAAGPSVRLDLGKQAIGA